MRHWDYRRPVKNGDIVRILSTVGGSVDHYSIKAYIVGEQYTVGSDDMTIELATILIYQGNAEVVIEPVIIKYKK